MNEKTITKVCDIHLLEYEAKVYKLTENGPEHVEPCPECIKDAEEARVEEDKAERVEQNQKQVAVKFKRSGIPPRYTTRTFDNFKCQNKEQEKALRMAKDYADNISEKMETGAGLIMSGKPGTGKTHLACAVGEQFMRKGGDVLFITVSAMIRKVRETYSRQSTVTEQEAIDSFSGVGLLIIDEIGLQRGSDDEEHLLFEIINERYSYFKPTIIISNLNASDIKQYIGERALDRMREGGGKFIPFDWHSYRSQVAGDDSLPNAGEAKYLVSNKKSETEDHYVIAKS